MTDTVSGLLTTLHLRRRDCDPVPPLQDFLFYWHFGPKEEDPQKPNPVIFWTNGGPGCSAMEGAINELGPLSLFKAKDGSALYTGTLSDNPYSWNAFAHLVTVDQPRSAPEGRNRSFNV